MRIIDMLHGWIDRFIPMDQSRKIALFAKGDEQYNQLLAEAKNVFENNQKAIEYNEQNKKAIDDGKAKAMETAVLKFKHKAILFIDQWYMQYVFILLHTLMIPKIKDYLNGQSEKELGDHPSDFEAFLEYQRFKNNMK